MKNAKGNILTHLQDTRANNYPKEIALCYRMIFVFLYSYKKVYYSKPFGLKMAKE